MNHYFCVFIDYHYNGKREHMLEAPYFFCIWNQIPWRNQKRILLPRLFVCFLGRTLMIRGIPFWFFLSTWSTSGQIRLKSRTLKTSAAIAVSVMLLQFFICLIFYIYVTFNDTIHNCSLFLKSTTTINSVWECVLIFIHTIIIFMRNGLKK